MLNCKKNSNKLMKLNKNMRIQQKLLLYLKINHKNKIFKIMNNLINNKTVMKN